MTSYSHTQIKIKLTVIIYDCCCHRACSKHGWWTGWLNGHSEFMVTLHIHVIHCRYHGSHNSVSTRSHIKRHGEWPIRIIVNFCNDRESEWVYTYMLLKRMSCYEFIWHWSMFCFLPVAVPGVISRVTSRSHARVPDVLSSTFTLNTFNILPSTTLVMVWRETIASVEEG